MTYIQFLIAIFGVAAAVMFIATIRLGKTINAVIDTIRGFCARTN